MRRLALLLPLVLACLAGRPALAGDTATAVVQAAIDGFIRPGYAALSERTGSLDAAVEALCAAPSAGKLDAAREHFRAATDAWSAIETVAFGPITEDNRLERLLFWPDRKGIGLRQVQAAIAGSNADAADPAKLATMSVAMQGFGALEFVLFGTGSDTLAAPGDPYRCRYGAAIAANVAAIAGDVEAAWRRPDGFAREWANPGPGNPLYQNGDEAVTQLLKVFVNGLEMIRDVRLAGFLGEHAEGDRPRQAIYWRSAGTARSLTADLAGMKALFDISRLGEQLSPDTHWIAESIDFEFDNAVAAGRAADGPIADVLKDPIKRGKLDYLRIVTSSLSDLFGRRLSAAFGLTAGFSSLDGD
jgi:predicted lipoprotein